jgi:hypothetical protein
MLYLQSYVYHVYIHYIDHHIYEIHIHDLPEFGPKASLKHPNVFVVKLQNLLLVKDVQLFH